MDLPGALRSRPCYHTAMAPPTIVVLGALNMDLVAFTSRLPGPGETVVGTRFLSYPGGKGANQAVAAARMGARVRMVGRVGDDYFGRRLLEPLQAAGVDVSGVGVEEGASSGTSLITIDDSAQNRIIQIPGANLTCGPREAELAREALEGALALMLQLEIPLEVTLEVAREAAARGVAVILDPGPARPLPAEAYGYCAYMTPNEPEAEALVGFPVADSASAGRAARELVARGAGCAIITLDSQGCYCAGPGLERHFPALQVEAVDTVGAGDAFNGALAMALAEGQSLEEAVQWATACGGLSVTRSGAQDSMPCRREVEALVRDTRALQG